MKKIIPLLVFILLPFLVSAQSVLITPGAQSINGDSTIQNQLNAFGNGLLVGPKVKYTDVDPASNVHIMDCGATIFNTLNAGTLKDPNGDSDYLSGIAHDCTFNIQNSDPLFLAFQIDFEVLDTEAYGDTVFLTTEGGFTVYDSFSGNILPTSIRVSTSSIRIRFKTNSNPSVGAGFVLKWRVILRDDTPTAIQNYSGEGLVYDMESNSLWAGRHNPLDFANKGIYSTAMGSFIDASGDYSTAMGLGTDASGDYSTAMGSYTWATGDYSTTMGRFTQGSGEYSTAMGYLSKATGDYSTALGRSSVADTSYATAMGYFSKAKGYASTAMGYDTEANSSYATAMGILTKARGQSSTAMGSGTVADSTYATAMGKYTKARGYASTSMGHSSEADSSYATAMGKSTIARGRSATAMGEETIASGDYSTAMGEGTTASGDYATAMGENTGANGNNSTAIGKDVIANGQGTVIIGDSNPGGSTLTVSTSNQFVGRFYNGYYLLTSEMGSPSRGVRINHDQTAWSSISDSTKKENFITADGDDFLEKLKGLKLGSWNYKTKDKNPERFYGPMAQEVFAAYGKDAKGTIGSDTLVSTLNMDGLLFIFAQELEKRTANLKEENNALKSEVDALKENYEKSLVANKHLKNDFDQRISQLEKLLTVKSEGDLAKLP